MTTIDHPDIIQLSDLDRKLFPVRRGWLWSLTQQDEWSDKLPKAKRIVVSHQRLKQAIVAHYEVPAGKIHVVGHGPSANPITPADPVTRRITKEVYGKEHSFFFAPTQGHPSDNLERLFAAYDIFRTRCPEPVRLLVQFPEDKRKHSRVVRKARKNAKFSEDIVFLPNQSDHEHRKVFSSARAVLYPSLSTRFPLPVLDAWTAEVPVLYGDNDILKGAGTLVQSEDVKSIAEGMVALVTTPFLASGLVENGKRRLEDFNWEKVAERVAGVLNNLTIKTKTP